MNDWHPDDRPMLGALLLIFAAALAYAGMNDDIALALMVGLPMLAASAAIAWWSRGGVLSQSALPTLGMALVGLTIHLARGHAEAHFAVFAFLAVTTVYRRALPVLAGAVAIALHHLSFNYFQQWGWGPICFTEPGLGRVLEHAAYVVAEAGVLLLMAFRAAADQRASEELQALTNQLVDPNGRITFGSLDLQGRHPGTRRLIDTLNQIRQALTQVQRSAGSIGSASQEIASGSLDLSNRTEQAAANLERTAGSMAQLTDTVNQSAESARTATELAAAAADTAQRGGAVVGEVVNNMREISAASRKIADIIGVIDGIAFQTNILALNAAVEAARAGEQGRGFAVVASEVRSLAGRSATAAREIKALIGASVDTVESGTRLVESAGGTMQEVVSSVQRVATMINDIAAATAEQSQGIGEVNQAMSHLDQMTQQNAALVEQSNAAAEALKDQAGQLTSVVERFQLNDTTRTA